MTVTVADLQQYVGADLGESDAQFERHLAEATALVDKFVGSAVVPEAVLDSAVIQVGADLWNRRNAPNGVVNLQFENFGGDQGQAVRIARDPMQAAYPILRRWVLPF